jgi:hypothetical protein
MEELDISSLKQHAVNELFKIKYAMKMYPHDVNEEKMILISQMKLTNEKINAVKNNKVEKQLGYRIKAAELELPDPSATATATTTTASADEDSLEKRLAALKKSDTQSLSLEERLAALPGGSRSIKRRSIKRRRTRKRRGTKQRQQGIKRRTKSRH